MIKPKLYSSVFIHETINRLGILFKMQAIFYVLCNISIYKQMTMLNVNLYTTNKRSCPFHVPPRQVLVLRKNSSELQHKPLLPGACGLSPHDVERGTGRPWYATVVYLSACCSVRTSSSASRCYLCILCARRQIYRTSVY